MSKLKKINGYRQKNKKHYHLGILSTLSVIFGVMIYPHMTSLLGDEISITNNSGTVIEEYLTGDIEAELTGNLETELTGDIQTELTGDIETELTGNLETELTGDIQTELTGDIEAELTGYIETELTGDIEAELTGNLETELTGDTEIQQLSSITETGILPEITGLTININPTVSGYVGLSGVVEIFFSSNKILTGITSTIYGTNADEITNSGLDYKLKLTLTRYNLQGSQNYIVNYQDLDGNTGEIIGTGLEIFDKIGPEFSQLEFTGNYEQVEVKGVTNENSLFKIIYGYSGLENLFSGGTNIYGTSFSHILTGLDKEKVYNFNISFYDIVQNLSSYSGNFYFDGTGNIKLNYTIDTGYQEITTGTNDILLLQEIKKFNECKEGIKYSEIKANISYKDYYFNIPNFKSDETKRVVALLSYDISTKLNQKNVKEDQINDLLRKYNNFLTIIKLVKDDENACSQNFSLYYISKFQNAVLDILSQ